MSRTGTPPQVYTTPDEMSTNLPGRGRWKRFWGQIRWQLAVCYLLIGGVSVLLVAALAAAALNMVVLRGSIASVERQIDLVVQSTGVRIDSLAGRLEAQAEAAMDQKRRLQDALPPRLPPRTRATVRCQDAKGGWLAYSQPATSAAISTMFSRSALTGWACCDDATLIVLKVR